MHATEGIRRTALARDFGDGLPLAQVAIASLGVVLLVGAFLVLRRLSGALLAPLPPTELAVTATVLAMWALCFRVFARPNIGPVRASLLPLCALLLIAVACSYPGTRIIDWAVWLGAVGVLAASDRLSKTAGLQRSPGPGERDSPANRSSARLEQVVQQITRYRTAAGQEVVRGTLTAHFTPGERTLTLYAAFCPPFERLPRVDVEVVDVASAVAKLTQVLHNGIQIEVRLQKPASEPCSLPVEFFAAEPTDVG